MSAFLPCSCSFCINYPNLSNRGCYHPHLTFLRRCRPCMHTIRAGLSMVVLFSLFSHIRNNAIAVSISTKRSRQSGGPLTPGLRSDCACPSRLGFRPPPGDGPQGQVRLHRGITPLPATAHDASDRGRRGWDSAPASPFFQLFCDARTLIASSLNSSRGSDGRDADILWSLSV